MGHMKDTPGQEVVKLPLLHLCDNEMESASKNKHTYVTDGIGCHRAGVDSRQMLWGHRWGRSQQRSTENKTSGWKFTVHLF